MFNSAPTLSSYKTYISEVKTVAAQVSKGQSQRSLGVCQFQSLFWSIDSDLLCWLFGAILDISAGILGKEQRLNSLAHLNI